MNAITHKAAYSLFPKPTFEKNLTLFTSNRTAKREEAIQKYVDRGWTLVRTISDEDQENESAPFHYGKRWVTDDQSWVIPLDASDIGRDDDPLACGSFNLCRHINNTNQPEIRFVSIVNPALPNNLVINHEFGVKVKAYIRLIKQMYDDPYGGWDPSFYSEQPPNMEEDISEWNDICKDICNCTYEESE